MATPYALCFMRYAPFTSFGGGFEGDTRSGPGMDPGATCRTGGIVGFTKEKIFVAEGSSTGSAVVGPYGVLEVVPIVNWFTKAHLYATVPLTLSESPC